MKTGPTEKTFDLVSNKHNVTLCGTLLIGWELVKVESSLDMVPKPLNTHFIENEDLVTPVSKNSEKNKTTSEEVVDSVSFQNIISNRDSTLDFYVELIVMLCIVGLLCSLFY
jgi:hypothetical protein